MCSIAEVILYHGYFSSKLSYPITGPRLLQYLSPSAAVLYWGCEKFLRHVLFGFHQVWFPPRPRNAKTFFLFWSSRDFREKSSDFFIGFVYFHLLNSFFIKIVQGVQR